MVWTVRHYTRPEGALPSAAWAGSPVRIDWRDLSMKVTRRSLLLLIAVVCFVLSAIGIGFSGVSLLAVGLAAFAGAFLVGERGLGL
jgi:hypothetical protein